ncbi:MAG: DNA mismatch repair endonuclease MutL [Candidatus Shikimatogenerans bostrichidophilus]|nr:MAG: DNA mismatch repair endonuclease MutL [Candidatus Shikimatogenerans bostrichidophilus]
MNNTIKFLPGNIINKILSGQTIINYSSIIKELVENSIDAKSKNISIYIDNYTENLMVIDDGIGMSYKNAILSFLNGTTSKIENEKDLFNIKTIGFRGNALYSISNISIMEIITKDEKSDIGIKLLIEYGKLIKKIPFYCNKGSCFIISNIFLNDNYKFNFLLNKKKEYNNIIKILYKIIVCYKNINFKIYHNNKLIFFFKKSNLINRIYNIFFKNIKIKDNFFLKKSKNIKNIKFKIYLLNYIYMYKYLNKNLKFIFINNKFIKNNKLYNLINKKLKKYFKLNNFIYFLFIKLNNKYINYNIVPDKTKIIFNNKIKINKIINKFLEFLINKNYFINKNILNKFFLKKKKKKKKKNIYIKNMKLNILKIFF